MSGNNRDQDTSQSDDRYYLGRTIGESSSMKTSTTPLTIVQTPRTINRKDKIEKFERVRNLEEIKEENL